MTNTIKVDHLYRPPVFLVIVGCITKDSQQNFVHRLIQEDIKLDVTDEKFNSIFEGKTIVNHTTEKGLLEAIYAYLAGIKNAFLVAENVETEVRIFNIRAERNGLDYDLASLFPRRFSLPNETIKEFIK